MRLPVDPLSTSSETSAIVGSVEPRLWTPPLRELTPETSYGFEVVDFANDVLEHPLDRWEEWIAIHVGELLPDGRPRFRIVIILVARQNGKTELLVVITLYWLYVDRVGLVLGTSTKLDYAAESWRKACRLARRVPDLAGEIPRKGGIRKANGEQTLWRADQLEQLLDEGSRYKIAATNEETGRTLTVDRLVLDELRQHHDYSAWDAAVPTTTAIPDAQVFALSNAGDDKSVVLNEKRAAALKFIQEGIGDPRVGLFEYSALPTDSPLDPHALAKANPNLGHRIDLDALLGAAMTAVEQGGDALAGFKTEHMCIRVPRLDPAIDAQAWADCLDVGDLSAVRDMVALCIDVSIDGLHATLAAAALLPDGRTRVEIVAAWSGRGCTQQLRDGLGGWLERIRPRALGWFPAGPAAVVAADLAAREIKRPLPDLAFEEIRGEVTAVCMGFSDMVTAHRIAHSADPMLDAHVEAAEKLWQGDAWRYARKGAGHVDGAYAAAGAAHIATTLKPPSQPRIRSLG